MEIIVVLFVLYALECCLLLTKHQVAFVGASRGRFRAHLKPQMALAREMGVLFLAPLHPRAIALICDSTAREFDAKAIEHRWSMFRDEARLLSYLCVGAWFYVLVATPLVIVWRGLAATWPALVLGWLGFMILITVEFTKAFTVLYPGAADRWSRVASIVLSPFSAIRASTALSRHLVSQHHPVAVGFSMCNQDVFLTLARQFYFDADRIDEQRELKQFLVAKDQFDDVLRPPPAETVDMRSYCPRCRAQYLKSTGGCADCPAVDLVPLRSLRNRTGKGTQVDEVAHQPRPRRRSRPRSRTNAKARRAR